MLADIDGVSSRIRRKRIKLDISKSIGLPAISHVSPSRLVDIDGVSSRTHAKRRNLDIPESVGLRAPSPSRLVAIYGNSKRHGKRRI